MRLDAQRTAQEAVYLADAAVQEDTQLGKDQCSRCRNALAHTYLDLGQPAKALELWEQVRIIMSGAFVACFFNVCCDSWAWCQDENVKTVAVVDILINSAAFRLRNFSVLRA